jgi:hypothetical protein
MKEEEDEEGGYMTEAQALALRFKADWKIWSNPMPIPSKALQAYEAEGAVRENISLIPDGQGRGRQRGRRRRRLCFALPC